MSADEIEAMLYRKSGMLGLSGVSSDFRELLASPEPRARLAIEVFVHRVARGIGSLAAVLGGLDGLVFTAGVGENAAAVRERALAGLEGFGVEVDAGRNAERARNARRISPDGARVDVLVVPTNEELEIARQTVEVVAG